MSITRKPAALNFVWNIDLTITVKCGGKKMYRTRVYDAKGSAEAYAKGWFGDHPHNIRWTFVRSKKELAARAA